MECALVSCFVVAALAVQVSDVRRACLEFNPPLALMAEYDFKSDTINPELPIDLRENILREYVPQCQLWCRHGSYVEHGRPEDNRRGGGHLPMIL